MKNNLIISLIIIVSSQLYASQNAQVQAPSSKGTTTNSEIKTKYELFPLSLKQSIRENDAEKVHKLISEKPSLLESRDAKGNTPLIFANEQMWLDKTDRMMVIDVLLDLGADKTALNTDGRTATSYAQLHYKIKDLHLCKQLKPEQLIIVKKPKPKPIRSIQQYEPNLD